jgi:septum formation protein
MAFCAAPIIAPIILASRSPRRRELLAKLGVPYEIISADIDESELKGEKPLDYVRRVARGKAQAIAAKHPGRVVLAADTPVLVGRRILQTPETADEARVMLKLQSNRRVYVPTAVVVVDAQGVVRKSLVNSWWKIKSLKDDEIESYLQSGKWRGISGGLTCIDCAHWLVNFYGSSSGSEGLPLYETAKLLRASGVAINPFEVHGA